MKILILGSGGVGGYFGAKLAISGADVSFVTRGKHFRSISKKGLRLQSSLGNIIIKQTSVFESSRDAGIADVIMNCVKMWDLEDASYDLKYNLDKKSIVIPFQNGIDSEKILCKTLGNNHVVGGLAHISAKILKPGVIDHNGKLAKLIFGVIKENKSRSTLVSIEKFKKLCFKANIDTHISGNISLEIWKKFIFLVAFSGVTTLTKKPIGLIRRNKDLRDFFYLVMEEVFEIAEKFGIRFRENPLANWERIIDAMPFNYRASMYEDLRRGRKLELPWLSLRVVQLGRQLKVNTPKNLEIVRGLESYIDGKS